jgi:trk system potassium uptake protein TrkH
MYVSSVFHVLGWLIGILGAFMAIPLGVSLIYGEHSAALAFAGAIALAVFVAGILIITFRGTHGAVRNHDAVLLVVLMWVVLPIMASFVFFFESPTLSPVDSFFEAVSGFTTTGATILPDLNSTAHGILLWRALLQWLGGLAIIVLAFTILPSVASGALVMQSMLPQGEAESLLRRLRGATLAILPIYAGLTAVCWLCLILTGLSIFDAACMAMSTLSTGGFAPHSGSVAAFDNPYAELVLIVFMIIGATNFLLHRDLILTRRSNHLKDPEFKLFLIIVGVGAVLFWVLLSLGTPVGSSEILAKMPHLGWMGRLRVSVFAAVSTATTTGYVAGGMVPLPASAALFLMALMLIGGSTGSTAGGLKVLRVDLLVRHAGIEMARSLHPHGVFRVRYGTHQIGATLFSAVWAYFLLYLVLLCATSLALSLAGVDFMSAFTAAAAMISNAGPLDGALDPSAVPYRRLPDVAKWVLCAAMVLGRMEIFAALTLLNPQYWRR